jgi:hypothetical protein
LPNDHVQTLIELLRPAGPDLARRLVSALLFAPAEERVGVVDAIERQMVELYAQEKAEDVGCEIEMLEDETQRNGYVEQVFRTYGVGEDAVAAEDRGTDGESSGGRQTGAGA